MEKRLYPSRWRPGLVFLVFLWLLVTAASVRSRNSGSVMISFIFACAVITSAVSWIPGAAWLKLDSQGFTVRYWFKESIYHWTDVKEFRLITLRYLGFIPLRRSVSFKFSESYQRNIVSRMVGALAQFDRNFPDNYGMKAKDLLIPLKSSRRQAMGDAIYRPPAIEPK